MRRLLHGFWNILVWPFRFIKRLALGIAHIVVRGIKRIQAFFTDEAKDTPLPDTLAYTFENPGWLLEHIDAMRKHLLRSVIVLFISAAITFGFVRNVMEFLVVPLEGGLESLTATEVTENVGTVMRVALLTGFAFALPYITLEIYLFIAPGLRVPARIRGLIAIPVAVLFFLGGMAFAYYALLPVALPILFNFMGLTTQSKPSSYFNFVIAMIFWMGMAFELPLAAYILAKLGLLRAKALMDQWRLAIVILAILSAAITPTGDPLTMGLVMIPMAGLYILSIGLAHLGQRGQD